MARTRAAQKAAKKSSSSSQHEPESQTAAPALPLPTTTSSPPTAQTDDPPRTEPQVPEETAASAGLQTSKKTKPTWDAFSRYFSDNRSSFPDYGAPQVTMKSLKRMNASGGGPINTMAGQSVKAARTSARSPEQTNARPTRDGVQSTNRRLDTRDPGSQFLASGPQSTRRERAVTIDSIDDISVVSPQSSHAVRSRKRSASPDDIAVDDPPPSRISSDLSGQKRPRAAHLVSQRLNRIKRQKDSSYDEPDELQIVQSRTRKSLDTAYPIDANSGSNRRSRGDIKSTYFTSPPAKSKQSHALSVCVLKAAAGNHHYSVTEEQQRGSVFLRAVHGEPEVLAVVDGDDRKMEDLAWMEVDLRTTQSVLYSDSSYIQIKRPLTGNRPAIVNLQLDSTADARRFLHYEHIHSSTTLEERETVQMRAIVRKAMTDATQRNSGRRQEETDKSTLSQPLPSKRRGDERRSRSPITSPLEYEDRDQKGKHQKDDRRRDRSPLRYTRRSLGQSVSDSSGLQSRRSQRSSPNYGLPKSPIRWTSQNHGWAEEWDQSLTWPPTGKNRARVDKDDIYKLDEGVFLNDNLISFWILHLQHQLESDNPAMLQRVYFFSTFFFQKLKLNQTQINYAGVKNWTSKVDIFSYDYLVVPVNEDNHWYLAIICHPSKVLPQIVEAEEPSATPVKVATIEKRLSEVCLAEKRTQSVELNGSKQSTSKEAIAISPKERSTLKQGLNKIKQDPEKPRIITLDSLGSPHPKTVGALRNYLAAEAEDKKRVAEISHPPGLTAKSIPQQDNWSDCGIYVLAYIEQFLRDPDDFIRHIVQKEDIDWNFTAPEKRKSIRQLIFMLQGEQQQQNRRAQAEKAARRRAKAKDKPQEASHHVENSAKVQVSVEGSEAGNPAGLTSHPEGSTGAKAPSPFAHPPDSPSSNPRQTSKELSVSGPTSSAASPKKDSSNNASSSNSFHTARSTPAFADSTGTNELASEATQGNLQSAHKVKCSSLEDDVVLLGALSSSPSSVDQPGHSPARKRENGLQSTRAPSTPTPGKRVAGQVTNLQFAPRESIEADDDDNGRQTKSGVVYDGISREGQSD